jgi:hypothetical protein
VNSDRLDTHLLGGPNNTACDLSSVGDQDLVKSLSANEIKGRCQLMSTNKGAADQRCPRLSSFARR